MRECGLDGNADVSVSRRVIRWGVKDLRRMGVEAGLRGFVWEGVLLRLSTIRGSEY